MVINPTVSLSRRAMLVGSAGVLAAPAFLSTAHAEGADGRKVLFVDASETSTGNFVSLETIHDGELKPGGIERDVVFTGTAQFTSGATLPVDVVIARDYANSFAVEAIEGKANAYYLLAGGKAQPANAPQVFTISSERKVRESPFVRVAGQVEDPQAKTRVNYCVTHDPEPTTVVVIAIVAGLALLICAGVVLSDQLLGSVNEEIAKQCGKRGAKSVKVIRTYGFAWREGGVEVGCGTKYEIVCN